MLEPLFTGICTALVTPFAGDGVDFEALRRLIDRQIEAGVRALLVCGTTGEASTLTEAEWRGALICAVEAAAGKALVIAGTGTNSLKHTLSRARCAQKLHADAQLVVTPYYNKTTQEGLVDYFTRVADATALPVILYNVPSRTGLNMLPGTAAALGTHPNIRGIKEAGGSLNQIAELIRATPLPVYCGSDELAAPALQLGAQGVISVLSNLCPASMLSLWDAVKKGCAGAANARQQALSPLNAVLFSETSPAPVKAALGMLGLCAPDVRSPLVPVQPQTQERLRALVPGARL